MAPGINEKVKRWIETLDAEFLERDVAVRLAILAPLSGQHVLLLGPPGTAKTMLAQQVAGMLHGTLFTTLLTKFSTPEDLFGPLSLPALEQGRYERLTGGYLPAADVAFVDEIYKANGSILNALLSILNERVFYNGSTPVPVPLKAMLAASNEVPDEEDGLDALDDRILLRATVDPIAEPSAFGRLLRGLPAVEHPPAMTPPDVDALRDAAKRVARPDSILALLLELRELVRKENLAVSDRRWKQAVDVMATCAALDGDDELRTAHLGLLRHALWRRPPDQRKVVGALAKLLLGVRPRSVTATSAELKAQVSDLKGELEHLQAKVEESTRYGYGYGYGHEQSWQKKVESAAREVVVKTNRLGDAIDELLRAMEAEVAGTSGLWRPFWRDVMKEFSPRVAFEALKGHKFLTQSVPQHFPTLLRPDDTPGVSNVSQGTLPT